MRTLIVQVSLPLLADRDSAWTADGNIFAVTYWTVQYLVVVAEMIASFPFPNNDDPLPVRRIGNRLLNGKEVGMNKHVTPHLQSNSALILQSLEFFTLQLCHSLTYLVKRGRALFIGASALIYYNVSVSCKVTFQWCSGEGNYSVTWTHWVNFFVKY